MLDYLGLTRTHRMTDADVSAAAVALGCIVIPLSPKNNHRKRFLLRWERHGVRSRELNISTEACAPFIPETRITMNPTRFNSFEDVTSVLSRICDLSSLSVSKMDLAIDLPVPLEEIWEQLLVPLKRARSDWYQTERTGIEYGKYPEQLLVYDKAKENGLEHCLTRLEFKQSKDRVVSRNVRDIPKCLDHSPFGNLKLVVRDDSQIRSTRDAEKADAWTELSQRYGATMARKKLNRNGNFPRDFAHLLRVREVDLSAVFREQTLSFFGRTE